jgi:hypothetical protein
VNLPSPESNWLGVYGRKSGAASTLMDDCELCSNKDQDLHPVADVLRGGLGAEAEVDAEQNCLAAACCRMGGADWGTDESRKEVPGCVCCRSNAALHICSVSMSNMLGVFCWESRDSLDAEGRLQTVQQQGPGASPSS